MLIKKYGAGRHARLAEQQAALERLKTTRPQAPAPYMPPPKPPEPEPVAEAPAEEGAGEPALPKRRSRAGMRAASSERLEAESQLTMRFDVLTLFPEIFDGYLGQSLLKQAIDARAGRGPACTTSATGRSDKHHKVDDRPFGGGPGMVLKVEPVVECVEAVQAAWPRSRATWSCSRRRGGTLDQTIVEELAAKPAAAAAVRPVRRV